MLCEGKVLMDGMEGYCAYCRDGGVLLVTETAWWGVSVWVMTKGEGQAKVLQL
jgi:hypothetical protein